ncbi:MAG: efflux RND transporter permease subunit [Prevotella sp.]
MLDKIIRFSLHNRLLVLVASVLLMVGGVYTAFHTEVDVFPDLNAPTVVVMTEAGGMATEEVEQLVTFPVETAVNGATGVRRVRSSSTTGFSVVWVEFDWDTDVYKARQIVSEKLATIGDALPDNVNKPVLGPQSSILGEVLIVGLTSDETSMLDLRTLADWVVRPRLLSTGGVAQVSVLGGDIKEYQIRLRPERMKHYGVTLGDVMSATGGMNSNVNGGVIYEYGNEYIVRGLLSTDVANEIGRAVVKATDKGTVMLDDVADVTVGAHQPKLGVASVRGKQAVLLTVTKQPNTGTIELTENLERALDDLKKNMPADVRVSTDIFRQSDFIDSSIANVQTSLAEGALFVVIVLFLFLANVRTTVISLVTLPLSLIVALLTLHYMGLSINTMSLGGMAIAIGSLVDDAIVDVENVWKHIRENRMLPEDKRQPIKQLVFNASREVRMPILNSTIIIIVSFVPLFFLSGMEGKMLIPLGIAFIVALIASTVVALTLTPVLCSYLLKGKEGNSVPREAFVVVWLKKYYGKSLLWVLGHKKGVLMSTFALFVCALGLFFTLGHSFLPKFNEGSFTINISSLPGISLEESDNIGRRAERLLLSVPEIKTVARKTGRAELDEHALGVNVSEIEAPFVLRDRSYADVLNDIRHKLSTIVGANIEIGQPISHRIDAMLSGTQANIAIKVFGDDLGRLFAIGNNIKERIAAVEGIADLNVEQQIERPELRIVPKREMLIKYGITMPEFARFVTVCLSGATVSQVYEKGRNFDLVVRVDDNERGTMERIADLTINTADGRKMPLVDVADVVSSAGPNTVNRENVKRRIVISANTDGRDLRSVVNDIRQTIERDVKLPEGYHVEYGGQFENEQAASRTLLLLSVLSIIVIFLLLYMQFHNLLESGVVLLNLPLALIGGVFALLLTTGEVSIPAIIGFISLFGIATRNGMLLINRYNTLRAEKCMSLDESIVKGSLDRLNPILMTALTSALALIPLALRGGLPGNEIQSPMAKVILGGLLTSTFLNVFIIPIVYGWVHGSERNEKEIKSE